MVTSVRRGVKKRARQLPRAASYCNNMGSRTSLIEFLIKSSSLSPGTSPWVATIVIIALLISNLRAETEISPSTGPLVLPDKAKVVRVRNEEAMKGYEPQNQVVHSMFEKGLLELQGKTNLAEAWRQLVSPTDRIGIKVVSSPGKISGTRLSVVEAIVIGLMSAGTKPAQILVWDRHLRDLRLSGFMALAERYGITIAGASDSGYDDEAFYESSNIGKLIWNDHEFGKTGEHIGKKSFVSKLVTKQMDKIILVSPLLNHNEAGVHGQMLSLSLGATDNTLRFELDPTKLAVAVPEIFALPQLGDKVVLSVTDALICQYQGEQLPLLHYSSHMKQLLLSKDPVALDSLAIREIERQRQTAKVPSPRLNWDLYQNANLLQLGINDHRQIQVTELPP